MTYEELLEAQYEEFPNSMIISLDKLIKAHTFQFQEIIKLTIDDFDSIICYYLPYKDSEGKYENGVRYGIEENYLSLPHVTIQTNES